MLPRVRITGYPILGRRTVVFNRFRFLRVVLQVVQGYMDDAYGRDVYSRQCRQAFDILTCGSDRFTCRATHLSQLHGPASAWLYMTPTLSRFCSATVQSIFTLPNWTLPSGFCSHSGRTPLHVMRVGLENIDRFDLCLMRVRPSQTIESSLLMVTGHHFHRHTYI